MTWRILSKTRTLELPSWWLKPARFPASQIGLHLFSEYFVPLPSLYSQWIWNWEGCQAYPVNWSKGMLWVLLIPSAPAGQPQSPNWEVGREDTTLPSHSWGSTELCCFLRYISVPPLLLIWGLNLAYRFTAQVRWATSRHTAMGVQQKREHMASDYSWGTGPPSAPCPYPAPWPKINTPTAILRAGHHRDGIGEQRGDPRAKC